MQLAIPFGASLAAGGLGSLLGRVNPTAQQQQVQAKDQQAQNTSLNTGQNLLGMGQQAVGGPLNYWSSILSGNKGLATSALAPEISQIGQGYQAANNASAALMPRGGPRADVLGNMPFQQQRDVSSLFQTARPQAAQAAAGLGTSLLGQGANSIYASTAAGNSILGQQQFQQQLEAERGQKIGGGLFSIFQQYGMPALQQQFPNIFKIGPGNTVKNLPGSTGTGDFGGSGVG